jgi:hypothetical protein
MRRLLTRSFLALCVSFCVVARAEAASLSLTWSASPDSGVVGYLISYGTQPGVYIASVKVPATTTYTLSNLTTGTAYFLTVRAYNSAGVLSDILQEITGVTGGTPAAQTTPTSGLTIDCAFPTALSTTGEPVAVSFSPTISGGQLPVASTCTPSSGSLFNPGSTPVTCTATDAAGSFASCSSAITVKMSSFGISCPIIPTVTANNGKFANVSYPDPTVTGGAAPVSASCYPSSGSQFPVGNNEVTCSASDSAGQLAMCTTTATVLGSGANTPSPTEPPPTGTVTFSGTVARLNGKCPSTTFSAGGYQISTSSSTAYSQGSCGTLTNNKAVQGYGVLQSNGTIVAKSISYPK